LVVEAGPGHSGSAFRLSHARVREIRAALEQFLPRLATFVHNLRTLGGPRVAFFYGRAPYGALHARRRFPLITSGIARERYARGSLSIIQNQNTRVVTKAAESDASRTGFRSIADSNPMIADRL
jgi:hypothetical protein